MKNEMTIKTGYEITTGNLGDMFKEELEGIDLAFDRIKVPSGGGLAYEVPSDDPESPDMAKEFEAVILYHHPVQSYYKEKFTGENIAPDCASYDGKIGVERESGETRNCKTCPLNAFGSGDNGGKACKTKRRLFLLREGELLPTIFTIPTGSIKDFSGYIMRMIKKGKKTNDVVTKFSLKKAQNKDGITYSKVVCNIARELEKGEKEAIKSMIEEVKALSVNVEEGIE